MALDTLLVLLAGIAIVVYGADETIKRLLSLSRFFQLSAFVTGVVIAGTLAVLPELSIGVLAALEGSSSFGLGIILGANAADLTLVIGMVVLVAGKQKMTSTMLRNLKISIVAVLLPVLLLLDGEISGIDGLVLVVSFLVYVSWLLVTGRKEKEAPVSMVRALWRKRAIRLGITVFLLIIGITVLFIGSELVTESAQELSTVFGLPLFLIGVVVAIGTTFPEMAFAIRASETKNGDIGLGNILGNVLADSMLVIGIIALIQPIRLASSFASSLSTGVFVVLSAILLFWRSRDGEVGKKDAILLIIVYAVFLVIQYLFQIMNI